jgi:signal peptidase II
MPRSFRLATVVLFVLLLTLVGCDHATKAAAVESLAGKAMSIGPGVDLVYTENHDIAFSALSHLHLAPRPWMLAAIPLLLCIGLAVRLWQKRSGPPMERAGYLLLLAGALGNVIDRIARGYVVDFIYVHHWPVFNVADVLVVVGMVLLAMAGYRRSRAPQKARVPTDV